MSYFGWNVKKNLLFMCIRSKTVSVSVLFMFMSASPIWQWVFPEESMCLEKGCSLTVGRWPPTCRCGTTWWCWRWPGTFWSGWGGAPAEGLPASRAGGTSGFQTRRSGPWGLGQSHRRTDRHTDTHRHTDTRVLSNTYEFLCLFSSRRLLLCLYEWIEHL